MMLIRLQFILTTLLLWINSSAQSISEGKGLFFDHIPSNYLSITISDEQINSFLLRLQQDFGSGEVYQSSGTFKGEGLKWNNINFLENGRIATIKLIVLPFRKNKKNIIIGCFSEKGIDMLSPKTEDQKIIKQFFRKIIKD